MKDPVICYIYLITQLGVLGGIRTKVRTDKGSKGEWFEWTKVQKEKVEWTKVQLM